MGKVQSVSVEGAVLVARRGNAYWFITGIYRGQPGEFECKGLVAYPVSADEVDAACNDDSLEDRFWDAYVEFTDDWIRDDCSECGSEPDGNGCSECGYDSFREWCADLIKVDGLDVLFGSPGSSVIHILQHYLDPTGCTGAAEFAGTAYRGNIFGDDVDLYSFDEFYNRAAFEAAIEFSEGWFSYDEAKRAIYEERASRSG